MANGVEDEVKAELRQLCHGRAMRRPRLHNHIGGNLRAWATVSGRISDDDARQQIIRTLDRLSVDELPPSEKLIVDAAMALQPDFHFPNLQARTEVLAERLAVSARTARRRIDDVLDRLAHLIANAIDPDDLDSGWALERMNALVRLDGAEPEVIEQRTITATRAGLRRISARFSLPREQLAPDESREVHAQVLHGARIIEEHRDGKGHFRHVLELPHSLARGEDLTYTMAYRVVDGYPIRPYYALVPVIACATFAVRIRFAPGREPRSVWLIESAHYQALADLTAPSTPTIEPDGASEVGASFTGLRPGFGYGIAWTPLVS